MGLLDDMRKQATQTGAKIQTSEAADLEKILNKLFYLDKNIEEETRFLHNVMTRGLESQERVGLHASAIIKPEKSFCLRQQVLSLMYRQLQGEQVSIGLRRIFSEGDAIHEKWQRLFIRGGYATADDLDVTQFDKRFHISFTPDIICRIPEFYNGEMIGEIKSVNTFQFKKMRKHPTASLQCQFYMYLTGCKKGFVLNEDKNTQDFKVEVYDYDYDVVKPFIERCRGIKRGYNNVLRNNKIVKRPEDATSSSCKRCKECALRNSCWCEAGGKQLINERLEQYRKPFE